MLPAARPCIQGCVAPCWQTSIVAPWSGALRFFTREVTEAPRGIPLCSSVSPVVARLDWVPSLTLVCLGAVDHHGRTHVPPASMDLVVSVELHCGRFRAR